MDDNKKITLYKIDHVTKVFGNRFVLNDVNFQIKRGEIFGIIGTSGCGKTTLLNLLVGFIKPDKGAIYYHDLNKSGEEDKSNFYSVAKHINKIKRMVGFAAQQPSFYPNLTVQENLKYFGSLYSLSKEAIAVNSNNLLLLMSLNQSQHVLAKKLSGGMQRRLDIACSLMHDPKILILDEPTADLDPVISEQIWDLLKIINESGTTIILSSHHLSQLENFCDRIALIKENRIVAIGQPEEVKNRCFIGKKIQIKLVSGNYEKVVEGLKRPINKFKLKDVISVEEKDRALLIHAYHQKEALPNILAVIQAMGEEIASVETIKVKLEEAFINLSQDSEFEEKTRKKKEKRRKHKKNKK